jgi:glycosyltransferase involved in cell wall biosynthesis
MKIVFICFYEAYPPTSGAASVTYNVVKYSQGERILIQLGREARRERTDDGVTVITLHGASENKFQKIKGLLGRIKRIAGIIESMSPDVIVLEGASWVMYHWLLLRQIRRLKYAPKVIYHSHNVEYYLRKEKHGKIVTGLTFWAEKRILRDVDITFAVSEVDSKQCENLYDIRPEILPNGVDVVKFEQVTETDIENIKNKYGIDNKTILFMGSYLYKPNREGIDFLVESVMPIVVQQYPEVRLAIIGGDVPYSKSWLINPGIIQQAELPAFVKACGIGVAPIFSGSGTRLKILEYMAARKPVVSTSKGAEGLNVINDRDIMIAEGAEDFPSGIVRLLSDTRYAMLIGDNGNKLVSFQYSWEVIMEGFQRRLWSKE